MTSHRGAVPAGFTSQETAHAMDVHPGARIWIVVIVVRPATDSTLRELLGLVREVQARQVSHDVFLVPDQSEMEARLKSLAGVIAEDGGHVMLANSVIIDDRSVGGVT